MNFLSPMLELNSPKSLHCKWFSLSEESIIRYCTVSYCRSAALEAPFFPSAYSSCKFISLKVVRFPTASSATLWGTSSSARCWRGPASAAICPNCTPFSRCQARTWERCTTAAHWSAQVRPPISCPHCRCAAFTMLYSAASRCSVLLSSIWAFI